MAAPRVITFVMSKINSISQGAPPQDVLRQRKYPTEGPNYRASSQLVRLIKRLSKDLDLDAYEIIPLSFVKLNQFLRN